MTDTVSSTLTGSLSGSTNLGPLTQTPFLQQLTDQDAHVQMSLTVEPSDIDKLVVLPQDQGPASTQQTLFIIQTDLAVQAKLNATAGLVFNLEPTGPLIIPGQPEVDQVEFTGLAASTATVFLTKIVGDATVPAIGGGTGIGGLTLDKFAATAGQTVFTLSKTPVDTTTALLFVEGVMYTSPTFFTISGTTLTWLDVPFTLPLDARVEAYYR